MRKVILYIAMTLDGMIADSNDGLSFLDLYQDIDWVNESYKTLLSRTDTLLMGRRTFEVIQSFDIHWPYPNHHTFVYSQKKIESDIVTMINDDVKKHVNMLKGQNGKDIWLVGGGKLTQSLLEYHLIDEMIITIIPIILGSGISLFSSSMHKHFYDLVDVKMGSNLVMLTYHKQIQPF